MHIESRLAIGIGAASVLLSFVFVGLVRLFAADLSLLDHPNPRSSHVLPTPRGGGAGAVAAAILLLMSSPARGDWRLMLALAGVIIAAAVGWIDDRGDAPVRVRLAAHIGAGAFLLPLALQGQGGSWITLPILAAIWIFLTVSAINVVNFMDGIDGFIGLQLLILAFHFAALGSPGGEEQLFAAVIGGCALGFLLWNWPRARIFLGDSGSGGLAVLGIIGAALLVRRGNSILVILLPLYPLCLDSFSTIIRRARHGERITEAHRTHLYQRLANGGWGHARVTLLFGCAAAVGSGVAIIFADRGLPVAASIYAVVILFTGFLIERRHPAWNPGLEEGSAAVR